MKEKLREELKSAHAIVETSTKKTSELEEKLKTIKPLDEATEKELAGLRDFQTTFAIEQQANAKYDPYIQQTDVNARTMLKQWGLPESVEKFIADNGGVMKMRYSDELMPDGVTQKSEWFRSEIIGNMTEAQKDSLEDLVRHSRTLESNKKQEIEFNKGKKEEWIRARQEESKKRQDSWTQEADGMRSEIIKNLGEAAKEIEIKPDMKPEEKAKAEKHNDRLKRGNDFYDQILKDFSPKAEVVKAAGAAQAIYLSELAAEQFEHIKSQDKVIADLTDKLGRLKNTGRTAKSSNAPIEKSKSSTIAPWKESDDQALSRMFKEAGVER